MDISRKEELRLFDIHPQRISMCLRSVRHISSTIIILDLKRCSLKDLNFILDCKVLRYCNLAENFISEIPDLSSMKSLQFLNIDVNSIEKQASVKALQACPPELLHLSLKGNGITDLTYYRSTIIKFISRSKCNLACLDDFIVSDSEWLQVRRGTRRDMPALPSTHEVPADVLVVPPDFDSMKSFARTLRNLNLRCKLLCAMRKALSPCTKIQIRLRKLMQDWRQHHLKRVLPILQATVRRKLLDIKLKKELFRLLDEKNCLHLFYEEHLRVGNSVTQAAAAKIFRFCMKVIEKVRVAVAARRLQAWMRKTNLRRKKLLQWLRDHRVTGLLFPESEKIRITRALSKVLRRSKKNGQQSSNSSSASGRVNFSTPEKSSRPFPGTGVMDGVMMPVPYLKLFSSRCGAGPRARVQKALLWDMYGSHRDVKSEALRWFQLYRRAVQVKAASFSPSKLVKEKSSKMLALSSKMKEKISLSREQSTKSMPGSPLSDDTPVAPVMSSQSRRATPPPPRRKELGIHGYLHQVSSTDRYKMHILKRRGLSLFPVERQEIKAILARTINSFKDSSENVVYLPIDEPGVLASLLWQIFSVESTKASICECYLDSMAIGHSAATSIQRHIRGVLVRKRWLASIVSNLILARAATAIQRAWKVHNGLIRRFKFLQAINEYCKTINSSTLYLDSWVFYSLIRQKNLSALTRTLYLFPEFRGVPGINSVGKVCFCPFKSDFPEEYLYDQQDLYSTTSKTEPSDIDQNSIFSMYDNSITYNYDLDIRFGIPNWVPWRPLGWERDLLVASRGKSEWTMFKLLTAKVILEVESFAPLFTEEQQKTVEDSAASYSPTMSLRYVRLQFDSVAEARARCGLLMLNTYHSKSKKFAQFLTSTALLDRLRNRSKMLIDLLVERDSRLVKLNARRKAGSDSSGKKQSSKMQTTEEAFGPLEASFTLGDPPVTVMASAFYKNNSRITFQPPAVTDSLRFRFLLEYLSSVPTAAELEHLSLTAAPIDAMPSASITSDSVADSQELDNPSQTSHIKCEDGSEKGGPDEESLESARDGSIVSSIVAEGKVDEEVVFVSVSQRDWTEEDGASANGSSMASGSFRQQSEGDIEVSPRSGSYNSRGSSSRARSKISKASGASRQSTSSRLKSDSLGNKTSPEELPLETKPTKVIPTIVWNDYWVSEDKMMSKLEELLNATAPKESLLGPIYHFPEPVVAPQTLPIVVDVAEGVMTDRDSVDLLDSCSANKTQCDEVKESNDVTETSEVVAGPPSEDLHSDLPAPLSDLPVAVPPSPPIIHPFVWSKERLLYWCSRNQDFMSIESNKSDASNVVPVSRQGNDLLDDIKFAREQYNLKMAQSRSIEEANERLNSARMKHRGKGFVRSSVLRECPVPHIPLPDTRFNRAKKKIETVVKLPTSRREDYPEMGASKGMASMKATDDESADLEAMGHRLNTTEKRRIVTDEVKHYSETNLFMIMRAKSAGEQARREREDLHRKRIELAMKEELHKSEIKEKKDQERQVQEAVKERRRDVLQQQCTLTMMVRKMESSAISQLKANRLQFLMGRGKSRHRPDNTLSETTDDMDADDFDQASSGDGIKIEVPTSTPKRAPPTNQIEEMRVTPLKFSKPVSRPVSQNRARPKSGFTISLSPPQTPTLQPPLTDSLDSHFSPSNVTINRGESDDRRRQSVISVSAMYPSRRDSMVEGLLDSRRRSVMTTGTSVSKVPIIDIPSVEARAFVCGQDSVSITMSAHGFFASPDDHNASPQFAKKESGGSKPGAALAPKPQSSNPYVPPFGALPSPLKRMPT